MLSENNTEYNHPKEINEMNKTESAENTALSAGTKRNTPKGPWSKLLVALTPVIIVFSGLVALLMAGWNASRIAPLLQWAADREGKEIYARVIHEGPLSPGALLQNPDQLQGLIETDKDIAAMMVMLGNQVVASFSRLPELVVPIEKFPSDTGAVILNDNFSVYRRMTGPGAGGEGGRQQGGGGGNGGGGRGPRWLRSDEDSSGIEPGNQHGTGRLSIIFVFAGPDRDLVRPLIYQTYLWPIVWLILTILWSVILMLQRRSNIMQTEMQKESNLAAIGRMSARLAHEIKNPLGAIRGMAQLLQKKVSDPAELGMVQTIEHETFRLDGLTRSILDFSRPSQCNVLPLNTAAVTGSAIDLFKQQHQQVSISFKKSSEDLVCQGDEDAIRQILLNLLSNAVDASGDNDTVGVEVVKTVGSVKILVSNYGKALPTETLEEIFEPFVSTKTRGYGLGLPISRKLAESMGGSLRLYNASETLIVAELTLQLEKQP